MLPLAVFSRCLEPPCPPGKKTDNPRGTFCVFPFTYGGKTYNACTMDDHSGLWCSLTAAYSGSWANCGKEQKEKSLDVHKKI